MLLANQQETTLAEGIFKAFSGELMILVLFILVVITLVILVPQLLRAHLRKTEMIHAEHLKALEQGVLLPMADEPSKAAGRTAMLVPMVTVISAATVTCFLIVYRDANSFAVALAVWAVTGVVCLAAITGGVALLGRLAQLQSGIEDLDEQKLPENPP
ncbi:MAG TPA: hypothetical protein VE988_08355 [Gemmataceae bacterium]|nr:hypothetical protein [Gemmataceae bacterium]